MTNEAYAPLGNVGISAMVLVSILLIARFAKGFLANISVLLGIIIRAVISVALGKTTFAKVGEADSFGLITPFHFGMPPFDLVIHPQIESGILLASITAVIPSAFFNGTENRTEAIKAAALKADPRQIRGLSQIGRAVPTLPPDSPRRPGYCRPTGRCRTP